jgi:hypothetical protein
VNADGQGHPEVATGESSLSAEYPKPWRLANEEAMLGALLDQADGEKRDEVTAAERTAIIRGGLRRQFGISRRSSSRLTLRVGGAALMLATVIPLLGGMLIAGPRPIPSWLSFSWQPLPELASVVLLVVAFAILALGVGREPGIAGRSIVGKVALVLFPVASLTEFLGMWSIPPAGSNDTSALLSMLIGSSSLLSLVALIVASIVVSRAGIIPGLARGGLIVLALATAAILTLSQIPNPPLDDLWAYQVPQVVQLATGSLYLLGGTARLRQPLAAGPTQA